MNENYNVNDEQNSQKNLQTVADLVNEIVDNTAPSCSSPSEASYPTPVVDDISKHNSHGIRQKLSQLPQVHSAQVDLKPTFEIYRATGQFSDSQSDIDVGICIPRAGVHLKTKSTQPSPPCIPPSYSTVIKQGRPSLDIRRDVRSEEMQHLSPFTRIPPPSYSEIHGVWSREISNASSEQVLLGPEPIYIWCTHCATVVITVTEAQRSKFTHLTAAALCLVGCWPCALLPYCMNSCKNIYHYCPDCNYLFGMYRPW